MSTVTNLDVDRWWLLVGTGLVIFMAQLDTTIVLVALPALAHRHRGRGARRPLSPVDQ